MSQLYRLFGLDFTPARLDVKLTTFEPTGFEIGCKLGFDRQGKSVREHNIFDALEIEPDSLTAMDLEDQVKYGNQEVADFVRDVLAGYEHAKAHMKMAQDACSRLSHCLYYLGRHRSDIQIDFPAEVLENFSKTEFYLLQADGVVVKSSDAFKHTANVSNGHLLVGPDQVDLKIDPEMIYDQDTCRAIHNYVSLIVETLYGAMEEVMANEQREEVVRKIRDDIDKKVKQGVVGFYLPEACPEVPNFYLTKE